MSKFRCIFIKLHSSFIAHVFRYLSPISSLVIARAPDAVKFGANQYSILFYTSQNAITLIPHTDSSATKQQRSRRLKPIIATFVRGSMARRSLRLYVLRELRNKEGRNLGCGIISHYGDRIFESNKLARHLNCM